MSRDHRAPEAVSVIHNKRALKPVHMHWSLATIVADFGDNLSPKTATVAEKCYSPNSATVAVVSPFSATVALFCDSRRFRRQSHLCATIALFCALFCDSVDRALVGFRYVCNVV